jgi:hypothetical protein
MTFFSFSSLRWWGSPQRSTWTWKQIAALPVIRKDLTIRVSGAGQNQSEARTVQRPTTGNRS